MNSLYLAALFVCAYGGFATGAWWTERRTRGDLAIADALREIALQGRRDALLSLAECRCTDTKRSAA